MDGPLTITKHVIERFRQRTGSQRSEDHVKNKIIKMVQQAVPVEISKNYAAITLMNHGYTDVEYRRYFEWIFVVKENRVITMHKGETGRGE